MKHLGVRSTVFVCYVGYITQAIIANFAPLLFLTFNREYGISLTLIGTMITVNFGVQLIVDLLASRLVDKIGYRPCLIAAHCFASVGLILLAVLPEVLPVPAAGLFIASAVYAVGGGLIEVLVSPIVESCPTSNKKAAMSLLHSFYSWGQVIVVALSTLFFVAFGIQNWAILACIWAIIPLLNACLAFFIPLFPLVKEGQAASTSELLRSRIFWLCVVLMFCAGAAELSVAQWASAFAESGLRVSKTMGDLLGPCMFAVFMGLSRVLYSLFSEKIHIRTALMIAAAGCAVGYCMCAFAPSSAPWLGLVGCGVVGFFVGILWPGTFSFVSEKMPRGGTALFALLALAGDVGCTAGPSAVGALADAFGGDLSVGIAFGLVFPVLAFAVLLLTRKSGAGKCGTEETQKS